MSHCGVKWSKVELDDIIMEWSGANNVIVEQSGVVTSSRCQSGVMGSDDVTKVKEKEKDNRKMVKVVTLPPSLHPKYLPRSLHEVLL